MSGFEFEGREVRAGDKIKIRYREIFETPEWVEVAAINYNGEAVHIDGVGWFLRPTIIAHQPAPRKVEVTLGEPLTLDGYRTYGAAPAAMAAYQCSADGRISVNGSRPLLPPEARRLALDILATVGHEEES